MSLFMSVVRLRPLEPISRALATTTARVSESSSSPPPKDAPEAVSPLPRVKFNPRAGFTARASKSATPTAVPLNSTPKPPPFQYRPRSHPARTSLEELQKLHPRPAPSTDPPSNSAAEDAHPGSSRSEPAAGGSFAMPRAPVMSAAGSSNSTFSATPRPRGRSSPPPPHAPTSSLSRSPKSAHDEPPAVDVQLKDTPPFMPIIWGAVGLLVALFAYEKGTALGWFGTEGGVGYMQGDRKAEADEIARKRREQWLEEVRLERLAKLKGTEPPTAAKPAVMNPAAKTSLETEKMAPAVAEAAAAEQAATKPNHEGQPAVESAGAGRKRRWGIF